MQSVSRVCEHDEGLVALQRPRVPRPRRIRTTAGWSADLTLLTGGVPPARRISVLVAESVGLARAGLRAVLEPERDLEVVGEACCGTEAVALTDQMRPDIVLMDLQLIGLSALEATRRIRADPNLSQVGVVILTGNGRDEDLHAVLRAGARGLVLMDAEAAELLSAIRVVADGGAQLPPQATRRLLDEFAGLPGPGSADLERFEELTPREREVVLLVALGLTNGEIAQQLVISPATAKTHVGRAMMKVAARERAQLVALAHQTGFVRDQAAAQAGRRAGVGSGSAAPAGDVAAPARDGAANVAAPAGNGAANVIRLRAPRRPTDARRGATPRRGIEDGRAS